MYLFLHGVLLGIPTFPHLLYHLLLEVLRELYHLQHLLLAVPLLLEPPPLTALALGLSQLLLHLKLIEHILVLSLHQIVLLCILKHLLGQLQLIIYDLRHFQIGLFLALVLPLHECPVVVHPVLLKQLPPLEGDLVDLQAVGNPLLRMGPDDRIEVQKPLKGPDRLGFWVDLHTSELSQVPFKFSVCLRCLLLFPRSLRGLWRRFERINCNY